MLSAARAVGMGVVEGFEVCGLQLVHYVMNARTRLQHLEATGTFLHDRRQA